MSKIIVAVHRDDADPAVARLRIRRILREITPDILRDRAQYGVECEDRHFLGALNLPAGFPRRGLGVCQGRLYGAADWWRPGGGVPDGSFALVRCDKDHVEAVCDPAGSRTFWWYFDQRMFVVSNSQRAITMYAGKFDFDRNVAPWLISTGSLGPERSYNRHLRLLGPGGVARLDKVAWTLTVEAPDHGFAPDNGFTPARRSEAEHIDAVEAAISDVLAGFGPEDARTTLLSLSGGCDSRLIANILHKTHPETAWTSFSAGPATAPETAGSDPAVAAEVARAFGFDHRFYVNDVSDEPIETRLTRFIHCAEGRIDHFKGYAGGMGMLRTLFEAGITSVIRGDHGLGRKAIAQTEFSARRVVDFLLCGDIVGLSGRLAEFGLDGQNIPERLGRRPDESLEAWRDRLAHAFYCPIVLGALNETKAGFTDILTPLLSERVLAVARGLPDALRSGKRASRAIVRRTGPDLPFATESGIAKMPDLLRDPGVARFLDAALASRTAETCFGPALTGWIGREIARADNIFLKAARAAGGRLARWTPGGEAAGATVKIDPRRLAFRVAMAVTMIDLLTEDATRLDQHKPVALDTAA